MANKKIHAPNIDFGGNALICSSCNKASSLWLLIDSGENGYANNIRIIRQDLLNHNFFVELDLGENNNHSLNLEKSTCFNCYSWSCA